MGQGTGNTRHGTRTQDEYGQRFPYAFGHGQKISTQVSALDQSKQRKIYFHLLLSELFII